MAGVQRAYRQQAQHALQVGICVGRCCRLALHVSHLARPSCCQSGSSNTIKSAAAVTCAQPHQVCMFAPSLPCHRAALQAEDAQAAAAGGVQLVFQDSDRQGTFVFKGRQVGVPQLC